MIKCWQIAAVVAPLIAFCTAGRALGEPTKIDASDCGTTALYHLLHLEGLSIGLDEIASHVAPRNSKGYSFRELRGSSADAVLRWTQCRFLNDVRRSTDPHSCFSRTV